MWLVLLILGLTHFHVGNSLPFFGDIQDAAASDQYLNTMPYSREQLMEVRKKLNLSHVPDPDEYLSVPELITKYGYPVEEHFTTTSDGYILRIHRIPPTRQGIAPCNRTIFLMHGLLMSSADWIILGPEKAFAYHLSDLGYDVWMGNARGNTQSRNHTKLKPSHSKFWDFSWHEIGVKDVPEMIDYVLKQTNQKALYHVGHSQGTTTFYVMCSELPHYNKKIIAHYSLAPIAYMGHAFSPILRFASKFVYAGEWISKIFGINEMLPHSWLTTLLADDLCSDDSLEFICRDSIFMICGFDKSEFNDTLFPTILGHTPAGASAKQMYHYGQLINSGGFNKYDYFPLNAIHYGPLHALTPPSYDLKKVTAPVYLYYSRNDWLSNEKDVTKLCKYLHDCRAQTLVAENRFNHLDYLLGIHAKEMIYTLVTDDIVNHLPKAEQLGPYVEENDNIDINDLYYENFDDSEDND